VEPIRRQQSACTSLLLLFHELNLFFLLLAYAGRKKVLEKSQSMVDRFDSLPPLPPHQPPPNQHHHHHHRISLVESSDEAAGYHRFNGSGNDASVNGGGLERLGEQPRHGTPSPPPYPSPPDDQPISNLLQVNSSFQLQTI
jgi:hypothetical protein